MQRYDVVVVGSGLTGLLLVNALLQLNINVLLLTKHCISKAVKEKDTFGDRLMALSARTCNVFHNLGIVEDFNIVGCPIRQIRAVDGDSESKVDFLPNVLGLEEFGYMVTEATLMGCLIDKLLDKNKKSVGNLFLNEESELVDVKAKEHETVIRYLDSSGNENTVISALLLGCDGKESKVRNLLGIDCKRHQFNQIAITCDIHHKYWNHRGIAVEKFYPNGPFAILPKLGWFDSSLVWTESVIADMAIRKIESEDVLFFIKERLGIYLGEIQITSGLGIHYLESVIANNFYSHRSALIGDAAHAVHPIAGQGFNLAVRDVDCIMKLITERVECGLDLGGINMLQSYNRDRIIDTKIMNNTTGMVNLIFSNGCFFPTFIRRMGLRCLDKMGIVKNFIMRYAIGDWF